MSPSLGFLLALPLAPLVGCATKVADTADTGPAGYTSSIGACERQVGEWPLETGLYVASTDAEVVNTCENAQGAGFHVNVGQDNNLALVTEDNCLSGDADGAAIEGWMTDTEVALEGYIEAEFGICIIGLTSTFLGTITGDNQFSYELRATAEPLDPSCDMMVGDEKGHTFGALPCEYGWTGAAILTD